MRDKNKMRTQQTDELEVLRERIAELEKTYINDSLINDGSHLNYPTPRQILDALKDFFVICNKDNNIVCVNKTLADCLGYSKEEIEGKHFLFLIPEDKRSEAESILLNIGAGIQDVCNIPLIAKNGRPIPVHTRITRVIFRGNEYSIAIIKDVNREERPKDLILAQRNLAINLSALSSLDEALEVCLDSAIHISGMDSGGIYRKDVSSGDFNVTHIRGLSDQFAQFSSCISWDSPMAKLVERKIPIYINHETFDPIDIMPDLKIEGLKSLAILPVLHDSQVHALLMVASHSLEHMPINKCIALESMTTMIGNAVQRLQMEEHKRTQERAQKDLYHIVRLMCDNAPDLIWAKNMKKQYIFANRAVCEKLLNTQNLMEPLGKTDMFFVEKERESHPDDPFWHTFGEICQSSDDIVMKSGKAERFDEFGNVRGELLYLDVNKAPIRDEKGKMIGTVGCGRDVTREKEMLAKLRRSEQRYRAIVEDQTELICRCWPDGKLNFVNETYTKYFGKTRNQLKGKRYFPYIQKEDQRTINKCVSSLNPENPVTTCEQMVTLPHENVRWIGWRNRALFDDNGKMIEILSVGRDITDQKKAEDAVRQSRHELNVILEGSPVPAFIIGTDHKVKHWNKAIETLTGIKKDEIIETDRQWSAFYSEKRPCLVDLLIDDQLDQLDVFYGSKHRKSDLFEESYHAVDFFSGLGGRSDGGRWLHATAALLRDSHGNVIGAMETLSDITTQKQAEESIQKINEELDNRVKKRTGELEETNKALQIEIKERNRTQADLSKSLEELQTAMMSVIRTLSTTLEMRDPYTSGHQVRVADLSVAIAREMGLTEEVIEGIRAAAIIHDIGKISIPAEILSKPDKLSDIEFSLIKTHPEKGYDIIKNVKFPWPISDAILQHHERIDGSGYPQGLKSDEIIVQAKIIGVADVVEAMASHRPYRPALGIKTALEEIQRQKGKYFDPDIADICLKLFREKKFAFSAKH